MKPYTKIVLYILYIHTEISPLMLLYSLILELVNIAFHFFNKEGVSPSIFWLGIAPNVPAVYDVLAARIRALRSKDQGRQNVAEVLRGNERSD
jgi:hypothetical protein